MEINLDPGRTPAELSPISASQTAALLRSGLAIGSELLGEAFPSVIKNVSAELGSRWDFDQLTPIVQRLLSSRPDDLRSSFLARLKEAQDEAYATLTADRQAPRFAHELSGFDAETLSLVDAFAVDSNTVVEKSANKLGGLLDQAMGDLNLVLGHIAGRGALKTNENPLGPFVVVKALLAAAEDQDLDPQARPLLLASFERPLAQALDPILVSLLEHYARHGVGVRAVRRAMAAARPVPSLRGDGGPNTLSGLGANSQFPNSGFGNSRFGNSQFGNSGFGNTQIGGPTTQGGPATPVAVAAEALNHIVARLQSNAHGTRMPALPPAGPPAQELMQSVD